MALKLRCGDIVEVAASALSQSGDAFLGSVRDKACEGTWEVYIPELEFVYGIDESKLKPITRVKRAGDPSPAKRSRDDVPSVSQEPPGTPPTRKMKQHLKEEEDDDRKPNVSQSTTTPPPTTPRTTARRTTPKRDEAKAKAQVERMFADLEKRCLSSDDSHAALEETPLPDAMLDGLRYRGVPIFQQRNDLLKKLGAVYRRGRGWCCPENEDLVRFDLFRPFKRTWLNLPADSKLQFAKDHGAKLDDDTRRWFVPGFILDKTPLQREGLI
mmetsp:Transcript_11803/g.38850  ORF Transcript_11803/g.38850 Transcript_11803/m.38850 type:complete len:270 (-) Transcript_11803:183-992(-)